MANQDFEQFKAEIKAWLDTHPDEYDRFVSEVNDKSASGLFKIFKLGVETCSANDAQVQQRMSWRPRR